MVPRNETIIRSRQSRVIRPTYCDVLLQAPEPLSIKQGMCQRSGMKMRKKTAEILSNLTLVLFLWTGPSMASTEWTMLNLGTEVVLPDPIHGGSEHVLKLICTNGSFGIIPNFPNSLDHAKNPSVSVFVDSSLYKVQVTTLARRFALAIPDSLLNEMEWGSLLTVEYPNPNGNSIMVFSLDGFRIMHRKLIKKCEVYL